MRSSKTDNSNDPALEFKLPLFWCIRQGFGGPSTGEAIRLIANTTPLARTKRLPLRWRQGPDLLTA